MDGKAREDTIAKRRQPHKRRRKLRHDSTGSVQPRAPPRRPDRTRSDQTSGSDHNETEDERGTRRREVNRNATARRVTEQNWLLDAELSERGMDPIANAIEFETAVGERG